MKLVAKPNKSSGEQLGRASWEFERLNWLLFVVGLLPDKVQGACGCTKPVDPPPPKANQIG